MEKVTAGRDALGEFAPQFAAFNDDVLFGEVWSREERLPASCGALLLFLLCCRIAQGVGSLSYGKGNRL